MKWGNYTPKWYEVLWLWIVNFPWSIKERRYTRLIDKGYSREQALKKVGWDERDGADGD